MVSSTFLSSPNVHFLKFLSPFFLGIILAMSYTSFYFVPRIFVLVSKPAIVNLQYVSDQGLVSDFELMFNNARHYNEEDSQVYRDADSLEKVLKRKMSQLVPLGDSPRTHKFKV